MDTYLWFNGGKVWVISSADVRDLLIIAARWETIDSQIKNKNITTDTTETMDPTLATTFQQR